MSKSELKRFIMFYERITKRMMKDYLNIKFNNFFGRRPQIIKNEFLLKMKLLLNLLIIFCTFSFVKAENHLKIFIDAAFKNNLKLNAERENQKSIKQNIKYFKK